MSEKAYSQFIKKAISSPTFYKHGAGTGWARRGLRYTVEIKRANLTGRHYVMFNFLMRLLESEFVQKLRYDDRFTEKVPFFDLANYRDPKERAAMSQLHPHPGGTLRRSAMIIFTNLVVRQNQLKFDVIVTWQTPYLRYLIEHGVSRHPGTVINFWEVMLASGRLRIKLLEYLKRAYRETIGGSRYVGLSITNGRLVT